MKPLTVMLHTFVLVALLLVAVEMWPATEVQEQWPSIPPEEFALKDIPGNPGAGAIILFRQVIQDDVKAFERNYYRIKILTDEGKKYADVEIPYVEKAFSIEDIRARTVQPDGKFVDFGGQVFDKLIVKAKKVKVQVKTFTLPDVHAGSIIEYSYSIRWRNRGLDILVNPERYEIPISVNGSSIPTAHWTISQDLFTRRAYFSMNPFPKAHLIWTTFGLTKDQQLRRQPDGTIQLEVQNVPAFQEEEHMLPESILKTRMSLYYIIGFMEDSKYFWRQLGTRKAEEYEKFIGEPKRVERTVNEIVARDDPPETKLRKLYDRAQQIRYLSYEHTKTEKEQKREDLRINKNVEDVLKRGYASANEINLLFVAFARAAGFKSSPVLLVPRDHGMFQLEEPDPSQLSAMVAWVEAGSKEYYLDPATLYCPFDLLPWIETGAIGIRVEKEGGVIVTTPGPKSSEALTIRSASLRLDSEGGLNGELHISFKGQEALEKRIEYRESDEIARRKGLEDEVKGWLPAGAKVDLKNVKHWGQANEPLDAEFSLQAPNLTTSAGRRSLLPLAIFARKDQLSFRNAKRVQSVYLEYPYQELDEITLQLPASQVVETLPETRMQNSAFGNYEISYQKNAGTVSLHRKMVMDGILFKVEYYGALRRFFDNVRMGDEGQIVLQNASAAAASPSK
ncbi:MAG: DUF3857 domain-containing protein [Acidobacteriia bacterium]|nr:DUF3857 domain-containing protein [Terriglobia bacterium]